MCDWYRYDENDGWKLIKACEATAVVFYNLFPVVLADDYPDDEMGEQLWTKYGYGVRRQATREKLAAHRESMLTAAKEDKK